MLDGAQWRLPCTPGTNGDPNMSACRCASGVDTHEVQIGGDSGQRWRVEVRIRGVMERMMYTQGSGSGPWYVGGAPGDGGNNYYKLSISSPPAHYFINHGSTAQNYSTVHDFTASFEVEGGAVVTFEASGQDGVQWEGVDMNDMPIKLQGITDPPQPYNGQFAVLSVVSVTAL